ncbi:hypothetical protein [Promineifilum sp.]|uniref:hypothetical protein n=1 Tax=Promineifilum sp. TaxID=2664178 RepID=UPI0035B1B70D
MDKSINHARAWRLAVALTGLYAAVWLALEGAPIRDLLLAAALLALALWRVLSRRLLERVNGGAWRGARRVGLSAAAGLAFGAGLPLLTLFLMALKTGLHAHGPEYSAAQIAWVWGQLPLWAGAGLLAGVGVGLVGAGLRRSAKT